MKDKLKKKERTTHISFNEAEPIIEVFTHNTDLKRRLYNYSNSYPDSCKHIETDEFGGALFIVKKGRFCFRLTKPYAEERRASAREYTIKNNTARRLKNQRKVGENDEYF